MKNQTLLLLAAIAGLAGLGWYLTRKESPVTATASNPSGSTLANALAPPKTLLETLAGLITPATPPSATAPVLTTPAPTVSPSLLNMYNAIVAAPGSKPKLDLADLFLAQQT